jgi:hypothetical protein
MLILKLNVKIAYGRRTKNTVYTDTEIIGKFPHPRYTNKKTASARLYTKD